MNIAVVTGEGFLMESQILILIVDDYELIIESTRQARASKFKAREPKSARLPNIPQ
jgi:hypothetical protein